MDIDDLDLHGGDDNHLVEPVALLQKLAEHTYWPIIRQLAGRKPPLPTMEAGGELLLLDLNTRSFKASCCICHVESNNV